MRHAKKRLEFLLWVTITGSNFIFDDGSFSHVHIDPHTLNMHN